MNFLNKLASGVYNTVNSIGSSIKSAAQGVGQYLGNQTAAAINTLTNKASQGASVQQVGQAMYPNYGSGINYPNGTPAPVPNIQTLSATNGPTFNQQILSTQGNSQNNVRPSTSNAPVDASGRQTTSAQGNQYYDSNGQLVTPTQGFSGLSGSSTFDNTGFFSSAQSGQQGLSGTGVAGIPSNPGAYGVGGASLGTTDEEQRKQTEKNKGTTVLNPTNGTNGNSPSIANALASMQAKPASSGISAPGVPNTIDAGYLSKVQDSINALKSAGSSISLADRNAVIAQLSQNLVAAKTRLDQQNPLPANAVEDTQAQSDFYTQQQDPAGARQAMDVWKAQNTNLNSLIAQRHDIQTSISALNDAYKPILDDIRTNPDLPKGLARRRIEDLAATQKRALDGLNTSLEQINFSVDDAQRQANQAFQIKQDADAQNQRWQQNLMQRQNQIFQNPVLLAGYSPEELVSLSSSVGIPVATLQKMKDTSLAKDIYIATNDAGTITAVDKTTGQTLWSKKGVGNAQNIATSPTDKLYTSGGLSISNADIGAGAQKLNASKGKDGYVNSGVYATMYNTWVSKGGLPQDFLSKYPPEQYANPNDSSLPTILRPKKTGTANPFAS